MVQQILQHFKVWAGCAPIMIYRAPGRLNLIGEHTDYNQGYCLPAAIQQSVYFALAPAHETVVRSMDHGDQWYPGQSIGVPDWAIYFKGVMEWMKDKGYSWPYFKLMFGGDLPVGAGLSSSSAIVCGFIALLDEFSSWNVPTDQLTRFAVKAEQASGVDGGMMDQICIMNGKKDHALFIQCSDWTHRFVPIHLEGFRWLIADTGVRHRLIDSDYNKRSFACKSILRKLKTVFPELQSLSDCKGIAAETIRSLTDATEYAYLSYVLEENQRVLEMVNALHEHQVERVGNLLLEGHQGLKNKYQVSCDELDFLVAFSRQSGVARGARMMGGGFGGSTVHLVPVDQLETYKCGMANAYQNKFGRSPLIFPADIVDGVARIDF